MLPPSMASAGTDTPAGFSFMSQNESLCKLIFLPIRRGLFPRFKNWTTEDRIL